MLARELGIGRPDVPHDYDDGGLVDVNHAPGDVLASCLGLAPAESAAVSAAREQLGRFTSPEELSATQRFPPTGWKRCVTGCCSAELTRQVTAAGPSRT